MTMKMKMKMKMTMKMAMTNIINNLSHYGDLLAIPFFALLTLYFYNIENKSLVENILFYFSLTGFILDTYFWLIFIKFLKVK